MKRMTAPEDVASVLEFLISDGAQFLNGVIFRNGGEVLMGKRVRAAILGNCTTDYVAGFSPGMFLSSSD
jgi:hypothetical protein